MEYYGVWVGFLRGIVHVGCFGLISVNRASVVCKKWKRAVELALGRKEVLSFAGWMMDDESTARVIRHAYALKELDMYAVSFSWDTGSVA